MRGASQIARTNFSWPTLEQHRSPQAGRRLVATRTKWNPEHHEYALHLAVANIYNCDAEPIPKHSWSPATSPNGQRRYGSARVTNTFAASEPNRPIQHKPDGRSTPSATSAPSHDNSYRAQQYSKVHQKAPIANIICVKHDPIFITKVASAIDLPSTCYARSS